ncbi:transmembrane protein 183 [Bicyclus anynana]|uniref:Transmembrane protein 183 n=1 Tax=Bicyclus anynana TaxID=110368 RepID=A0A6J1MT58_BICAN|nr:transmembrane protein 183 [Bicyclus anynana]
MPKKKSKKQGTHSDFTINDCANAPKPVGRVKKSAVAEPLPEKSWEDLQDDDLEAIIQKPNPEGVKEYKKKRNHSKCEVDVTDRPGIEYPEIVWYLISPYIKPEEIGNFAGINRATYSITKRESFWRALYKRYCQNKPKLLPEKFRIDNDYKLYGLQLRVIRALYHTYDVFIQKVLRETGDLLNGCSRPYDLVGRRCVNVWYSKDYCSLYFKLKKLSPARVQCDDFIKELGRIDANPEEGSKILEVMCLNYSEVPPLLGLTLTSVRVTLSQTCRHRRLYLGFNRSHNNVYIERQPECSVCINSIVSMLVYDWWDPKYPHFEIKLPTYMREEESVPVLKKDFFSL